MSGFATLLFAVHGLEDLNPFCSEWASAGQCKERAAYMAKMCPKSCSTEAAGAPERPSPSAAGFDIDVGVEPQSWAAGGSGRAAHHRPDSNARRVGSSTPGGCPDLNRMRVDLMRSHEKELQSLRAHYEKIGREKEERHQSLLSEAEARASTANTQLKHLEGRLRESISGGSAAAARHAKEREQLLTQVLEGERARADDAEARLRTMGAATVDRGVGAGGRLYTEREAKDMCIEEVRQKLPKLRESAMHEAEKKHRRGVELEREQFDEERQMLRDACAAEQEKEKTRSLAMLSKVQDQNVPLQKERDRCCSRAEILSQQLQDAYEKTCPEMLQVNGRWGRQRPTRRSTTTTTPSPEALEQAAVYSADWVPSHGFLLEALHALSLHSSEMLLGAFRVAHTASLAAHVGLGAGWASRDLAAAREAAVAALAADVDVEGAISLPVSIAPTAMLAVPQWLLMAAHARCERHSKCAAANAAVAHRVARARETLSPRLADAAENVLDYLGQHTEPDSRTWLPKRARSAVFGDGHETFICHTLLVLAWLAAFAYWLFWRGFCVLFLYRFLLCTLLFGPPLVVHRLLRRCCAELKRRNKL